MADTYIYLGDFQFQEFEIPDRIPLGGAQTLVIRKFPGGYKDVQPMGRDDAGISWSGIFTGELGLERARYLDFLRVQGKPLDLSFFEFLYTVVIRSFTYSVERFYRVPYTLELEVIQDQTQPQTTFPTEDVTASISDDSATAVGLGAGIGDGTLSSLLSAMDSAIKGVSDFANATQATLNSVLAPVSAVMQRIDTLTASVTNTMGNVATVGGILPNNPIAQQTSRFSSQLSAVTQAPQLYNLRFVTGRIQTNLNILSSGSQGSSSVTVGGGNLFDVAAKQYGDATKWDKIAAANKLTDPNLSCITNLTIPKV